MFNSRFERAALWAGNLFFLFAIALFVTLILLATGMVKAQDALAPDALVPDTLEPDALDEDALGEDALGIERVDFATILPQVDFTTDLPIAQVPPRPPQAIPMWFCWRCWAWHTGFRPRNHGDDHRIRCDVAGPEVVTEKAPRTGDPAVERKKTPGTNTDLSLWK